MSILDDAFIRGYNLYVEEKPSHFYLRGGFKTTLLEREKIVVDGETFVSDIPNRRVLLLSRNDIDYESGTLPREFINAGYIGVYESKIEVPPFFSYTVHYPHGIGLIKLYFLDPDKIQRLEETNPQRCSFYSENKEVNMMAVLAESHGVDFICGKNDNNYMEKMNEVLFVYCVYRYGFGNGFHIRFRFDDLLNMNPAIFSAETMERFKSFCSNHRFLREVLNLNVFERELTDVEKLECAASFMKYYGDFKRKKKRINQYETFNRYLI